MRELWKPVLDEVFFHYYEVSNLGQVRSVGRYRKSSYDSKSWVAPRIRKLVPRCSKVAYPTVMLCVDGHKKLKLVHVLIIEAFKGKTPKGKEVRHKDGDFNNLKLSNLEFGTRSNNHIDKRRHGKHDFGENATLAKFSPKLVRDIRIDAIEAIYKQKELAVIHNCNQMTISHIKNYKTWNPKLYEASIKDQIKHRINNNASKLLEELKIIDPFDVSYSKTYKAMEKIKWI